MAKTRTEGLRRLSRRARILPAVGRAEIAAANDKSADDFVALVRRIIPKGDTEQPELESTLAKQAGSAEDGETGVTVSIGGPQAPYPLHLEGGHRAANGKHVPGRPFWNPARQVTNKRHKSRAARALRKAIKASIGGGDNG